MSHPLSDMMAETMEKLRGMVDVNAVIGDPITTPDGMTIIPVSKVTFGYGGGGSDLATKAAAAAGQQPFGGGSGAGATIQPISFLIVKGETVRMLPVASPTSGAVDRLVELLPDLVDKLSALLKKDENPSGI